MDSRVVLTLRSMQVAKGTHDLDANLALLRFYQYQPSIAKPAAITKVGTQATPLNPRPRNPRTLVLRMGVCSSRMQSRSLDVDVFHRAEGKRVFRRRSANLWRLHRCACHSKLRRG